MLRKALSATLMGISVAALSACASNPTLQERVSAQANSSADIRNRLRASEKLIEKGKSNLERGERLTQKGQDQIAKGESERAIAVQDYCTIVPTDPVC